jgi:hypothetical protein
VTNHYMIVSTLFHLPARGVAELSHSASHF